MDSKQEFFAPGDVQVNLQCVMLISSAAYTHSMTKVAVQLFVRRFGPDHSSDAEFHAIGGTSRCLMAVLQLTDKVSEKGRQVYKVVSCTVYGDHLQNKPLLTRYFSLVYIEVVLSCSIQRFACIDFVPCSMW